MRTAETTPGSATTTKCASASASASTGTYSTSISTIGDRAATGRSGGCVRV